MKLVISVYASFLMSEPVNISLILYFQSLSMLQLSATLKAKAALLEKEAWGYFAASLAGWRTFGLWGLLEDLFGEISNTMEEDGLPSKKSHPEDEPSTSDSVPSAPADTPSPDIPQSTLTEVKVIFPMNEGLLHDSGISQEHLLA